MENSEEEIVGFSSEDGNISNPSEMSVEENLSSKKVRFNDILNRQNHEEKADKNLSSNETTLNNSNKIYKIENKKPLVERDALIENFPRKRYFYEAYRPRKYPRDENIIDILIKTDLNEEKSLLEFSEEIFKRTIAKIKITNITSKCSIFKNFKTSENERLKKTSKQNLNLEKLAIKIPNSSYNVQKIGALGIIIRRPYSFCRVFPNGSITSIGTNSISKSKISLRKVLRKIQRTRECNVKFNTFKLTSFSCVLEINKNFLGNLKNKVEKNKRDFRKDEELNLGYIWILDGISCSIKIYLKSGKIVLMGCQDFKTLKTICKELIKLLIN